MSMDKRRFKKYVASYHIYGKPLEGEDFHICGKTQPFPVTVKFAVALTLYIGL